METIGLGICMIAILVLSSLALEALFSVFWSSNVHKKKANSINGKRKRKRNR